jgi:hypothetical protein
LLVENRVSRYLLYALGEILLVVIRILIACRSITGISGGRKGKRERHFFHTHFRICYGKNTKRPEIPFNPTIL